MKGQRCKGAEAQGHKVDGRSQEAGGTNCILYIVDCKLFEAGGTWQKAIDGGKDRKQNTTQKWSNRLNTDTYGTSYADYADF